MSFFESLVLLLLAAILLLQVSRRLDMPYPTMLAAAGVALALVPGAPAIRLDAETALALFIAPALVDAAFDFPIGAVKRLWQPLFALAVVAVLLTAGVVAWAGWAFAGLPIYAAIALGGIVAPPDAAAATAVLSSVRLPGRSIAVLKGESLLNDGLALLLFSGAVAVHDHGGIDGKIALQLGLAAPGGILLGIVLARLYGRLARFVSGTLGGNLLEFVNTFLVWILAERLHLSAVLCVVAFAMTIARGAGLRQSPRMRVHSFAVWESVVFLLNVLAFLLMGMQARSIVGGMAPGRLADAAQFAGVVVAIVVAVRMAWVIGYNRLAKSLPWLRGDYEPATLRQGILVGWAGMRGLVTVATALALPRDFPQRDVIVLTAFAVVLATLIIQGITLAPLARRLRLDSDGGLQTELGQGRVALAEAALATLDGKAGRPAETLRYGFEVAREGAREAGDARLEEEKRSLGLASVRAQRQRLEALRNEQAIGAEAFLVLQEELDFRELAMTSEDERRIEES